MAGVENRRELWLGADEAAAGELAFEHDDADAAAPDVRLHAASTLCFLAGIAWIALTVWAVIVDPPGGLVAFASRIAVACTPLVLIGLVYLILVRSGRGEADRIGRASAMMRAEQARLDRALEQTSQRIAAERVSISEHADQLLMIGDDAAHRLRQIGEGLRRDVEILAREASAIAAASTQARSDFDVLIDGLPQARADVDGLVASIDTAGLRSHERAGALDAAVVALAARAREVDDVAGGAAQRLAAHLARVEGTSAAATNAIIAATGSMTGAIDATLDYATRSAGSVRSVVEGQSEAMLAIVAQGEAALTKTGADTAKALRERIDVVVEQMAQLGARLEAQRRVGIEVVDELGEGISRVDTWFVAFGDRANAQGQMLDGNLDRLAQRGASLATSFAGSGSTAETLVERAETLMIAIDSVTREIDETLPAAFARLDTTASASLAYLDAATPAGEQLARQAVQALDGLRLVDEMLNRQADSLAALSQTGETELARVRESADALLDTVGQAKRVSSDAAESANIALVGALDNVGHASRRAAQSASDALDAIAPAAAQRLSDAVRDALANNVGREVSERVGKLGETAERAMAAANQASDRLMRQMLTIAETSAQVEARIAAVRTEAEDADREDFSRRVALLIESLNSTAIDVAKLLSNDVSDASWAAYLKGDRGVFARRAVRLLDSAEVREIARHYGDDPEFREQVNRYIHDFEAMLRNVLATRNGSPLGVTLLSSDMGKLYVALAQAIERLRT